MGMKFLENVGNNQCSLLVVPRSNPLQERWRRPTSEQRRCSRVYEESDRRCEETVLKKRTMQKSNPKGYSTIFKQGMICNNYRCVRDSEGCFENEIMWKCQGTA
ncbi:hypothetical protein ABG768_004144 [Culter alburnus]|uniref:Uncharacterized protein n=1 Tax=Culter alburnus TaxID=194366 RepID=A0AAW1ZUQ3_CULAL